MRTSKLIVIIQLFSLASCASDPPSPPPPVDASVVGIVAADPGPCRDVVVPLERGAVTCHPGASAVVDFSPVTGVPVVRCTCRAAAPCACEEFLDWEEPEPEPSSGGPSKRPSR